MKNNIRFYLLSIIVNLLIFKSVQSYELLNDFKIIIILKSVVIKFAIPNRGLTFYQTFFNFFYQRSLELIFFE